MNGEDLNEDEQRKRFEKAMGDSTRRRPPLPNLPI